MLRVDVLTLFPSMFAGPFDESIIKRAVERGLLRIDVRNIRDWAHDRHRTVDDYSYGGGPGMLMKAEPLIEAIQSVRGSAGYVVLLTPQGRLFDQSLAAQLARRPHLVLVCGHYEGVDERAREVADDELSIGDFVLTGGELPAMVVIDAVARLVPGVLAQKESLRDESLTGGLLEYPQYTRPVEVRGQAVPDVLLSGDHGAVARWRRAEALLRTLVRRPDLLAAAALTPEGRRTLEELAAAVERWKTRSKFKVQGSESEEGEL